MSSIATTPAQLQANVDAANASARGATSDLTRAFAAIEGKQQRQTDLWGYYDGDQPLAYASRRLRDLFKDLDVSFCENWSAVVVDSLKDRVNLTGLQHQEQAIQDALDLLWDDSELNLGSDDVHEAALVVGESYLIIWPDEDGAPQAYSNDPRLCHVQYSAENPRQMAWAAKRWVGDDGKLYLTLYYPDRLEYYVSRKKASEVQSAATLVEERPAEVNPYEQVPVFHFRPQRRTIKGELNSIIPLQNAVNKLLADMMVAAEYGAFPQRWRIAQLGTGEDVPLKNAPNLIWDLPASDGEGQPTSVGQFNATDLNNYLLAIDNLAHAIGTISRTPAHYFLGQAGAGLSGEALIAMEGPLNKKAQDRIDAFTPTWQQAATFALKLMGQTVAPSEITPLYDKPETIQPRTSAEITQIRVASGLPLTSALRMEGLTEAELEQIAQDQTEEQAAEQVSLGQQMAAAARQFDAGQVQPMPAQGGVPSAGSGVPGAG